VADQLHDAPDVPMPDPALVVLIGPPGSGKSTAARGWAEHQVLSSDRFRLMAADDPHDQAATADALDLLHRALAARMRRRLTTVVDATNVLPEHRQRLLAQAWDHGVPVVAVVMATPLAECMRRNAARDRPVPAAVVRLMHGQLAAGLSRLAEEGFAEVVVVPRRTGGGARRPLPPVRSDPVTPL
jgi:predicted kinase